MLRASLLVLAASAGTAVAAETAMSPAEFEAWSTGKTLDYFVDGSLWGSEMHLANRSTVDADAGGACRSGHWYPQGDAICFVYDLSPGPYCWRFLKVGDQVIAEFAGELDAGLISVTLSDAPIPCDQGVGV
jgi:hypothetical protein